jgi:hypothetical protein
MAEQSFPFENIDTTESQFSEWATNFQETGVQGSPTGTELGITVTGSDLNLTIAAGQAFIRGHYYINTSDLVLAVPSAGVNTRIDIVVVELDPEANTIVTKIVSGTAVASDPVAPTLTQSATGIYQLPISTLTIPTSTVAITTGMLVDTRTFMGNRIGIWTTDTRPADPTDYQTVGYNTTIDGHEYWDGTDWQPFSPDLTGLIPKSTVTTAEDLIVADGASSVTRLGVGTDDQVLTVVAGEVAWADAGGGGLVWTQLFSGSIPTGSTTGTISSLSGYDNYFIIIDGLSAVSASTTFRLLINGSDIATGTEYEYPNRGTGHGVMSTTSQMKLGLPSHQVNWVDGFISIKGASSTSLAEVTLTSGAGTSNTSDDDRSYTVGAMATKISLPLSSIGFRTSASNIDAGTVIIWGA